MQGQDPDGSSRTAAKAREELGAAVPDRKEGNEGRGCRNTSQRAPAPLQDLLPKLWQVGRRRTTGVFRYRTGEGERTEAREEESQDTPISLLCCLRPPAPPCLLPSPSSTTSCQLRGVGSQEQRRRLSGQQSWVYRLVQVGN